MRKLLVLLALLPFVALAQVTVSNKAENQSKYFPVASKANAAAILYDTAENILVKKAAAFLASDIEKVSGKKPKMLRASDAPGKSIIIVATVGNNPLVEDLIKRRKIDVAPIKGKWERFIIKTIDNPMPGVKQALVIVGSDRRGAAYGVFTLSEQMGVSPWHYWADVPVQKHDELHIKKGQFVSEGPAVKYRGIFINDEAPALRNWATEQFGGLNHTFYEKVFELLLRNKANYLWPAMWLPTMFNVDDPLNPKVADEFGIVVSTSHHEPMMRAHNEWERYGGGPWNYETNKDKLRAFWRGGVERMQDYESVVTVGMRGDGDEAMSEETAVGLLKEIITDQRKIITDVTGKPASETPQVWAIYKEVQDYYDQGMRVDDDIIVLFSDDNWGNLRILPKKENAKGKYGMYYHFDYVGAPVSYKWLNTTQIERVWEQMNLAYAHGVKDLWIANVGDIKPMELPISFFMDYAWNPDAIKAGDLPGYYQRWAKQQFGGSHHSEIADLLALYTKYNARRTPEMLKANTYSIENYREADRILEEYNTLLEQSQKVYQQLPDSYKDSYYQLVHSPIALGANLNEMYVAAGKNKYYGERGATAANFYADKVKEHFAKDAALTNEYHRDLANGKWNHMMSQTHIGYTYWNHPPVNMMPAVAYVQVQQPAKLGYLLEHGTPPKWGWLDVEGDWSFSTDMPVFDPVNDQNYYINVINRGEEKLTYTAKAKNDWIKLSSAQGTIQYEEKVFVTIDWKKAPKGRATGEVVLTGAGDALTINVPIRNEQMAVAGYVENNGVVVIEAAKYTAKKDTKQAQLTVVQNLGRTGSGVIAEPVTASRLKPGNGAPQLSYEFTVFDGGELTIETHLSPTQDFKKQDGLWFAIAIDDEEPQLINMNQGETKPDWQYAEWWTKSVGDHIKIKKSEHKAVKPGKHTLKVWAVDTGVVFQKFVIDAGGLKESYLGPEESKFVAPK